MKANMHTYGVPKEPAERRAWIVYRLRYHYRSVRQFAAKIGVQPGAVLNALDRPSAHVEAAIGEAIGVPVRALFPDRFDSEGRRRHCIRPRKRTSQTVGAHVQTTESVQT